MERVSVGSLADWHRVKNSYSSSATNNINTTVDAEHLHDERDALFAHFSHFMDSTFAIAQANLRVNGHSFDSIDAVGQDIEAFDEALDRRIWSLADTRLQWHKRMAKTRREVPAETQARVSGLLDMAQAHDQIISELNEPMDEDEEPAEEPSPLAPDVAEEFHMTSAITQELNQNMASQQERVHRAEKATNQLRSLKY